MSRYVTEVRTAERMGRAMSRITEFLQVYRLYRHHHPRMYALRLAYGIAFRGLPF